jgi:SAM-dependent methyltransferase
MSNSNGERAAVRYTKSFDRCPFCGGRITWRYGGIRDRLETTAETFAVYECVDCRAAVLNPAPVGDVSAFYPENYLSAEVRTAERGRGFDLEEWYRYNQYRYDFKLLQRATGASIGEAASYVDLGCGSGERVTYARERGCARAVGVDKFDFAKRKAQQEVKIVNSEILEFAPSEKFEAVSLFHVLEHLAAPREVLAHIKDEILDTAGHLIVQVPNYGSLERRWFKGRWFGLDAPRHYWHFNQKAICRLLSAEGYAVEAVYQRNAPLHPVSIAPSISRDVDVQRIWVNGARGDRYKRGMTILWAGLTVLTIPVSMIESLCEQASMLTVVASKS